MGVEFTTFIAPGILMMTVIQNAFANTSSSLVISKGTSEEPPHFGVIW
jgi:ABC-2 type transport system permease protein